MEGPGFGSFLDSHLRRYNDWSQTLAGVSSPAKQNSRPRSLHLKLELSLDLGLLMFVASERE